MSEALGVVDGRERFTAYLQGRDHRPLFLLGDALAILRSFPPACIDCCMTSPPYWGQRAYSDEGIGLESSPEEYIEHMLAMSREIKRVLKPTGSFWLNIGDAYDKKSLLVLPWRVAIGM